MKASFQIFSCSGKQVYPDFNSANHFAKNMRRRWRLTILPYKCKYCSYYHVGKKYSKNDNLKKNKMTVECNFFKENK